VPATIQDIIRARIDRLEEPVKRIVQTASVIGREFEFRLLSRISEMENEVQGYVDTLKHLELIHETRFFPELEYIFKNAVTQDVAYQSLLVQRRKELHGAIGRAMEELCADRLEEKAVNLAYHYARSEHQDKAVEYSLLAGDRAAQLYANADAKSYFEQALTTVRALPVSLVAQRWEVDAILKLAAVGVTRQDIERDMKNLEQARSVAEALHDELRLAQVLYWFGRVYYVLSDMKGAIQFASQSLEIAERLGDETLAAAPVNLLGRAYWFSGELAKSVQMLERSTEQMRKLGNKGEESTAAGFVGFILGVMGEFRRGLDHVNRGIGLAREIQNPFAEAAGIYYRGVAHDQRGQWSQAAADYEEAGRVAERVGDLFRFYIIKAWEGRTCAMAGDPNRGKALVEESLALATKIGTKFIQQQQKAILATCLLALGQAEAVPTICEEAISQAEKSGDKWAKAVSLRTLGEAYFALDPSDPERAEVAIVDAIRLLKEIGAKPELARSHLGYARLLKAAGESEEASEHFAAAIALFQEMGMAWDLAQAEQALAQI